MMNAGGNAANQTNGHSNSILGSHAFVNTPTAVDSSDPFSLMTNAFNNMGMDPPNSPARANMPASAGASTGRSPLSQTSLPSSNDFFAAFSTGATPASPIHATSAITGMNDPFPLATSQPQHRSQPLPHGSLQSPNFSNSVSAQQEYPLSSTLTAASTGTKSFDDYLFTLGQGQQSQQHQAQTSPSSLSPAAMYSSPSSLSPTPTFSTASTTLSPQSTGGSNPFSKQQSTPQRAFTADHAQSNTANSNVSGQQSNPFAMFANHHQQQATAPSHLQAAVTDPFGRQMAIAQQQQQNFSASSGLGLPNPFSMSAAQGVQPPSFMRSASEPSHNFQNAFNGGNASHQMNPSMGNNNYNLSSYSAGNAGPSAVSNGMNFESAFSVAGAAPSRSMTVPVTNTYTQSSTNDMFGQWMKPAPMAASSKYPSIDDLDPFSTSAASSSATPVGSSAFSNPFSLNM
ncbi:hypothetical protein EDD21DRAFT_381757 [Dissophora ornata]|nr:hypothetical protein EDD21DRAFT_381757 [Dissophora ornata]